MNIYPSPILAVLALSLPLAALVTADGDLSDNSRFDGFSAAPTINTDYAYSQYDFTGVGWYQQANSRQFALVSPQHFVCATHFSPATTGQVSFLGSDGVVYTHEIDHIQVIRNADGNNTDLRLGTLETPVDTRVITPTSYANLSSTSFSAGDGIVFGKEGTATTTSRLLSGDTSVEGTIDGSTIASLSGNYANTTFVLLSYNEKNAGDNDAYVANRDSGSPSFIISNGKVGLIGTNSLISNTTAPSGFSQLAFASFVPEYEGQLSTAMAVEGYQMSPMNPEATTLAVVADTAGTFRQGYAGAVTFTLSNAGANEAGNVSVTIDNATALPSLYEATGYFTGLDTATSTELHTASLATGGSDTFTVSWDALPAVGQVSFNVTFTSDESGPTTETITFDVLPSFLAYSAGLTDMTETGDDDADNIPNLVEYAMGGDTAASSVYTATGFAIHPSLSATISGTEFSFLRRTDAVERGLTYRVEYSQDLETWDTLMDVPTVNMVAESGFEEVVYSDITYPKYFYRVFVDLNE